VIWLARRFPLTRRGVIVHILASVVLTVAKIAITVELLRLAGFSQRDVALLANLPINLGAYWAIAGATRAIEAQLRAARLQNGLTQARLQLLQRQLQPHFLFNTLNSIAELVHEDQEAADAMITRLSELLRASLDSAGLQEVPLQQEIGIVERYLDIQRVRFGDRLRTHISVEPSLFDALVPNFILQPLVENSIRHAVANRALGSIEITAIRGDSSLMITVTDDGEGFSDTNDGGVGLANVRERMRHLYGSQQLVEIGRGTAGGAEVRLIIPLRKS
jgi:LytS/YehU family sensor histidine kinase